MKHTCSSCSVPTRHPLCDDCVAESQGDGLALVAFCVLSFVVVVAALAARTWLSS